MNLMKLRRTAAGFLVVMMLLMQFPYDAAALENAETLTEAATEESVVTLSAPDVTEATNEPEATDEAETVTEAANEPESVTEGTDVTESVTEATDEAETVTEATDEAETVTEAANEPESVTEAADEPESVTEAADEPESVTEATDEPESVTEGTDVTESVTEAADEPESVTEATDEPESVTEAAEEASAKLWEGEDEDATPATEGVYAILYEDGTMVFQVGDAPEDGRAVTATYPVDMITGYEHIDFNTCNTPWFDQRELITSVDFKDKIAPTVMTAWFQLCSNLTEITNLSNLDFSNLTSIRALFFRCKSLKAVDVSGWDISGMDDIHGAFFGCSSLTELNVSLWDVSHVKDMGGIFGGTTLATIDVGRWDTSSVEDMHGVFANCSALTHVNVSGWDTSNVRKFYSLFINCPNLTELDLSGWDTSKGDAFEQMFAGCSSLTTIRASKKFVTSGVTEDAHRAGMFTDCAALVGGAGTAYSAEHTDDAYARVDTADAPGYFTQGVFAILYDDGTLVFQYGDAPEAGRAVTATYPVNMASSYSFRKAIPNTPWYNDRELITKVDIADKIAPQSLAYWFMYLPNLTEFTNFSNLDISHATSIRNAFYGCESLTALDLSGWDTSVCTDFHGAFAHCKNLANLGPFRWDTSNVTDMSGMFSDNAFLTELDLSGWDTSKVTDTSTMVSSCPNLRSLNLSGWDVSKVGDIHAMFVNCSALTELDLSSFDTSSATNMAYLFNNCANLKTIFVSERFVAATVSDGMFTGCAALVGGNGTAYDAEHTDNAYARIDADGAPGYFTMGVFAILYDDGIMVFQNGSAPEAGRTVIATYPVNMTTEYGQVDDPVTRHVPTTPWYEHHSMITQVDIKDKISPLHLSHWFMDLENLTEITHLENLDISRVINMFSAFFRCSSLKTLDIGGWDTSSVENMHALFYNCSALTELDVGGWDVSHVKDMAGMFSGTTLKTIDVGRWDTSGAEDMHAVFFNCPALTHVDVSGWDTSNVEHFELFFMRCPKLTEADLSGWDTSKGTSFYNMFRESPKLTTIRVSDKFVTSGVTEAANGANMFKDCASLVGGAGTKYDAERTDNAYARIDAADAPGYFTMGVFAILYDDGTMVFQNGDTPEAGRTVIATYPVNMSAEYKCKIAATVEEHIAYTPWYGNQARITRIDFKDKISPLYLSYWFMRLESLKEFANFDNLDVSKVVSMSAAFFDCKSLTELDVSKWDMSSVENMHGTFSHCPGLTELRVNDWDISNLKSIGGIFADTGLKSLDLSKWNTSGVTDMHGMFTDCAALTELRVNNWDTSSAKMLAAAFQNCTGLTELDLSGWDTSQCVNFAQMFMGCENLKTIRVSERFVTSGVTQAASAANMFKDCAALVGGAGTKYDAERTDNAYARIDTADAPGYFTMGVFAILYDDGTMVFQNGDAPEAGRTVIATYPVSLNTEYGRQTGSTVEDHIPYTPWYENEARITRVDFKDKISPTYIAAWFMCLEHLTEITHFDNLDISAVVNMSGAFYDCKGLTELDVSKWDTSNVQNMHALFSHCSGLTELAVSGWDTSSLTDIGGIFGATGVTKMDLSGWKTSGVTDMHGVFMDCAALTEVNVSGWDTSDSKRFGGCFQNCTGLTELDLSGWDTSNGIFFTNMFSGCANLKTIRVSENFVIVPEKLIQWGALSLFLNCGALVGGNGTQYDAEPYKSDYADSKYARIDAANAPGYFTLAGAETPEAYAVSFNANGGDGSMDSVTVIKGGSFTLPQNGFGAPAQKKFRIWSVGNAEYAPGSVLTVNAPVTVTAQWENAPAPSQGCYVATSVYGSYDCPEVWTLRRFRDNVLAKTWYGRLFIRFYYAVSPTAVKLFGDCEWFQNFFRGRLDKMVDSLQADGFASTPYQDKDW